jgi:hypothetical protein
MTHWFYALDQRRHAILPAAHAFRPGKPGNHFGGRLSGVESRGVHPSIVDFGSRLGKRLANSLIMWRLASPQGEF